MEEKYYLSRNQYNKMEAPTLKGTKLNMAIKGLDFGGLSKTLLHLHQEARDMAKPGLREHRDPASHRQGSQEVGGHWTSTGTT